ncbi:MAG: 4Fe-4S binding protein [Anaerolineae bacterium]|nr:4Fe-4S binding protein [Anaerolineae bacterium]
MTEITIQKDACTGCGACVEVCAVGAIALIDGVASIEDQGRCTRCEACVEACPNGAIVAVETLPATTTPPAAEIVRAKPAPVALPTRAAKVLPVLGSALTLIGQEVLPRLAPRLWAFLRPRESGPGVARPAGGGRRFRRRERGRRGRS